LHHAHLGRRQHAGLAALGSVAHHPDMALERGGIAVKLSSGAEEAPAVPQRRLGDSPQRHGGGQRAEEQVKKVGLIYIKNLFKVWRHYWT